MVSAGHQVSRCGCVERALQPDGLKSVISIDFSWFNSILRKRINRNKPKVNKSNGVMSRKFVSTANMGYEPSAQRLDMTSTGCENGILVVRLPITCSMRI